MPATLSIILISGTSHVGKSTLAGLLSEKLHCEAISTDSLARHPGRPWPGIPAPVEEYYRQLSAETIYWFLKVHHQNIWPLVRGLIDSKTGTGNIVIFEGAALRPEFIAPCWAARLPGSFFTHRMTFSPTECARMQDIKMRRRASAGSWTPSLSGPCAKIPKCWHPRDTITSRSSTSPIPKHSMASSTNLQPVP